MTPSQVDVAAALQWARDLHKQYATREPPNFLEFCYQVSEIVRTLGPDYARDNAQNLLGLKTLQDDYDALVASDPMMLYRPAHIVAERFHSSTAKIRYNRSANRTSKTQTGYAEHYFAVTGNHRFRQYYYPAATFIVGVNFSKYAPNVYEKKFLTGEPGNILSPMFPESGAWFHSYDERKHIITVACKECKLAGKPGRCKHPKSSITLYSDQEGPDVLQGAQFPFGHFDEHIDEAFFHEAMERLKTVPNSSLGITGTPLLGRAAWEYRILEPLFQQKKLYPGSDRLYVEIFSISQEEAGLVKQEEIDASKLSMDPLEQEARIYGRPAPLAKHGVFDNWALHEMEKTVETPTPGSLQGEPMQKVEFVPGAGNLNLWVHPLPGKRYIVGADIAAGLTKGDHSCASVLSFPEFELVAQYHGHLNPLDYAFVLAQLATYYNNALLVPERTGLGVGTITRLKEIGYWNLFRDQTDPSQSGFSMDPVFGVDTNIRTKSYMVAALQKLVKERQIKVRCFETLSEMRGFGQEMTKLGNIRLAGEGVHDDRVMSLVFAAYVALTYPFYVDPNIGAPKPPPPTEVETMWTQVRKDLADTAKGSVDRYIQG